MKNYSDKGCMGVCIELRNNNYGSMLQSFATQVMLKKYGFQYDLIRYKKKYTPIFVLKSVPRILNRVMWQDKHSAREKSKFIKEHPAVKACVLSRNQAFDRFRSVYFVEPTVYAGYRELVKRSKKYTSFLTGSDQLWSPSGLPTNFYNLMFVDKNTIKISYASSFGVKQVPWYQRSRTKEFLDRIQFISCRENSGAQIIRELTGRDVPVVADPTMLFDEREWQDLLPCKRVQEGKYIFSYILGTNKTYRDEVIQLSKLTGLPIVSIHQYVEADLNFGDVSVEDAGPAEFVDLIRHAEYVCTDSFHGLVFSTLHHKRFVIFNRYSDTNKASKNTRIESLCEGLGISARRFSGDIYKDMMPEIGYSEVDEKMEFIRLESKKYLENAFDSIKGYSG